jgi:hypothetical protein
MKKIILIFILASSVASNAQSLKDALYGGKLKNDSGTVVRKGDDLSTKIDTTTKKKIVDPEKAKTIAITTKDSSISIVPDKTESANSPATTTADNTAALANSTIVAPRDNNKIWKEYIDSLSSTLKTEALPNKKIKSGTYYLLIEYDIETDGQVSINNVSCSPENSFLQQTVKERLTLTAPQLNPVLSGYGKPRKASKKYNLTLSKM